LACTITHLTLTPPHIQLISMSTFHLPCTSTLKMEAAWSSGTLVSNHHTRWHRNPKNHKLYVHFLLDGIHSNICQNPGNKLCVCVQSLIQFHRVMLQALPLFCEIQHDLHAIGDFSILVLFNSWSSKCQHGNHVNL